MLDSTDPLSAFQLHRLPNGLQVWAAYLPERPAQAVRLQIGVGHLHEPQGLAHYTEHIVAHSQHTGQADALRKELSRVGGQLHGGTTSPTVSSYGFVVPAVDLSAPAPLWSTYLARLHTYVFQASLQYDHAIESGIFLAELNERIRTPLYEKERETFELGARPGYPYRQLPSLFGSPELIRHRPAADVQACYQRYYRHSNTTLITAGPVPVADLLRALGDIGYTQPSPGGPTPPLPLHTPRAPLLATHGYFSPELQSGCIYSHAMLPATIPYPAIRLAYRILQETLSDIIREEMGGAYGVGGDYWANSIASEMEIDISGLTQEKLPLIWQVYRTTFDRLTGDFLQQRYSDIMLRIINSYLTEEYYTVEIPPVLANRLRIYGRYTRADMIDLLRQVSLADVQQIIHAIHPDHAFTLLNIPVGWTMPQGVPIHNIDDDLAMVRRAAAAT